MPLAEPGVLDISELFCWSFSAHQCAMDTDACGGGRLLRSVKTLCSALVRRASELAAVEIF